MAQGHQTRWHDGIAVLVVVTACIGVVEAAGQNAAAPPPTPPGQTNGPLAYQDADGRVVRLTAVGASEDRSGQLTAERIAFPIDQATTPVWSPSGIRLAFTRRVDGRRQIFVTDEDKHDVRQLTTDPAEATDPTWSPTGRRIAFTSTRDGRPEIYTIDLDGDKEQRLTDAGGRQPDWSASGDRIAFTSGRSGSLDIWVMNVDGSDPRPVTSSPKIEVDPEWRPDRETLAYVGATATRSHIFVVRPDGSGGRALTHGAVKDRFPSWAPTGGAIAFTRNNGRKRSTRVVSTSEGTDATPTRLEIDGGVRADWGALPVPPANPRQLDGTTAVTPAKGSDEVSVTLPSSTQQAELARVGARVPDGSVVRAPAANPVQVVAEAPGAGADSERSVQAQVTGTFAILPSDKTDEAAVTLELRGDAPDCSRGDLASSAAAKKGKKGSKKPKKRRKKLSLKNAGGKVKAIAKHASGLTKRTDWSIEETCEGTLTTVREGQVEVEDRGLQQTFLVSAGETYLARAR